MRALIQRVMNAKIILNDEIINSIDQGACVFIGLCNTDTEQDLEYIARKILSMKLFDEGEGKWKKSVIEKQFEVLCVSQYTLYNSWKGTKPGFHKSMPTEQSKEFYDKFIQMLSAGYKPDKIKDGLFGIYRQVSLQNDGPVTFLIESPGFPPKVDNALAAAPDANGPEEEKK